MVKTTPDNKESPMTITESLDKALETIHEINTKLYRQNLDEMSNEQLGYEFADRVGDECREFDLMMAQHGREFVVDYLCDVYSANSYERLLA